MGFMRLLHWKHVTLAPLSTCTAEAPRAGTRLSGGAAEALGELEGVSPALAITNGDGEVSVRGICPTQLFQQDSAIRAVVERELGGNLSASVAVEVRADTVTRIEITADAANPAQIRTDDTLRFTVTAYDSNNVPVLHPVGSDAPLELRLAIASEGHAGRLRLANDEALGGQVLAVDTEGRLQLEFTVQSRATPADPILLAVRSLDGDGGVTFGRFRLSISVMGARCASGFTCSQVTETRIPASSASDAPARDARSPRGILFFFLPADDGLSCIGARPSDDSLRAGGERGVGRCGLAGSASGAFAVVNSILNLSAISLERRRDIADRAGTDASIGLYRDVGGMVSPDRHRRHGRQRCVAVRARAP